MVTKIAYLYFGFLAFGCLAPLPLVKLQEVGQGFYRFFGFTCLALETLSIGFYLFANNNSFGTAHPSVSLSASVFFLVLILCFTVSLKLRISWMRQLTFYSAVLLGFVATCIIPFLGFFPPGLEGLAKVSMAEKLELAPTLVYILHAFFSALVMGFVTLAMMLGHWYLVTPKLSIAPLKRFAGGYILLSLWITIELILIYLGYNGFNLTKSRTFLGSLLEREIIFVLFRVTWGVLAPVGFAYWIWETVKMKSTQSATGILYAAMVCTLVGEGMGLYLTLQTGVPF